MKKTFLLLCLFCVITAQTQIPDPSVLQLHAPETFTAEFTTGKGGFTIEVYRKWSPLAADRLYQLIKTGFFSNALFFRVEQGFVAQFGISASYQANRFWDPKKLKDEPAVQKNTKGTVSFARGGQNDRCTQLFINLADNAKLDNDTRNGGNGYTPVARVIKGMEILSRLNGRYGKRPAMIQDSLYKYGNGYFDQKFPGLDKILSAKIIR